MILVAGLLAGAVHAATPERPRLWHTLETGAHAVGYRSLMVWDRSRPPLTPAGPMAAGRPMRIAMWYPARGASGAALVYERYVVDLARMLGDTPTGAAARDSGLTRFVHLHRAILSGPGRPRLDTLLATRTAAYPDAPRARGRFPLVLIPSYLTPATVSVMAEYLASHGYVVASVAMKGTLDPDFDLGVTGLETMVQDARFVLGELAARPEVDASRVAVMGTGIAANGGLGLLMRDPRVRALVSLDGGLPSPSEDGLNRRLPYDDVAAATVPMLVIHAPHPSLDLALLDRYRYAERTLVHFPRMSEYHFLDYGAIEGVVPGVIGPPPGDVNAGHDWACRTVRAFLDATLGGTPEARRRFEQWPDRAAPDSLMQVSRRAALPTPPTLQELKRLLATGGADSVAARWRALRRADPEPVSRDRFLALGAWLANIYTGDPQGREARRLMELRVEAFPDWARARTGLAYALQQAGDSTRAREHAREALRLLDSDPDPTFTDTARRTARGRLNGILGAGPR